MEKIYTILAKYFNNQCDSNEQEIVQQWKEQNKAEFDEHKAIWDLTAGVEYVDFDANEGWNELQPKLQEGGKVRSLGIWVRMAAAVVIVISGWFLLNDSSFFGYEDPVFVGGINIDYENSVRGVELASQQTIQEKVLKGGDKVWLNKNSHLEDLGEQSGTYTVKLHKGEAFFDVNSRKGKGGGFAINTTNAKVLVMGTGFSVTSKKNKTIIRVEEGVVKVKAADNNEVELNAGEQAIVSKGKIKKTTSFSPNYLGWKNGELTFNGETLKESIHFLEEYYDVSIEFEQGANSTMGGRYPIKGKTVDQVLFHMSKTQQDFNFVTVKKGKSYRITK